MFCVSVSQLLLTEESLPLFCCGYATDYLHEISARTREPNDVRHAMK